MGIIELKKESEEHKSWLSETRPNRTTALIVSVFATVWGPGQPHGKLPRRLDWTGGQFLLCPVLGHFRTAGFEQGPRALQGETLLCRPNKRTTGDHSGLQIP